MQRYFQQQKAATIADRSQCAPVAAHLIACKTRKFLVDAAS